MNSQRSKRDFREMQGVLSEAREMGCPIYEYDVDLVEDLASLVVILDFKEEVYFIFLLKKPLCDCYSGDLVAMIPELGDILSAFPIPPIQRTWLYTEIVRLLAGHTALGYAHDYYMAGYERQGEGDFHQAIIEYDRAINHLDEYDYLEGDFTKVLGECYCNKALAICELGKPEEAIPLLDRAIDLDGSNPHFLLCKGQAYGDCGQYKEALREFDRALSLDSSIADEDFHIIKADALFQISENKRALEEIDLALQLNSRFARAYWYQGEIYKSLGLTQKAIQSYKNAQILEPENSTYSENLRVMLNK